ncbi:CQS_1a_G0043650.mRNA.1.CDS.1 [Saccharomyces cerevisiae]|nr:CQS_1a_G0006400.mRNA.1.CDS.1 [Saccharomyces cerevisiae]CAI4721094.1 CQS_1a_G0043650.mRNA.1.CDS.1 [Saccharomyces cerevisiae]CAI7173046.1 CQS_1a_G0006400.mRNA.1.CDS.1 [Saccharomyces cerevisiae]CAI7436063.1 CQS_1a_G0043650.mRNA.1.CDS.1 [Saccharomyces cerevisiae]
MNETFYETRIVLATINVREWLDTNSEIDEIALFRITPLSKQGPKLQKICYYEIFLYQETFMRFKFLQNQQIH